MAPDAIQPGPPADGKDETCTPHPHAGANPPSSEIHQPPTPQPTTPFHKGDEAFSEADRDMMRLALSLADQAAEQSEVPVGAVVYQIDADGQPTILGQAHNLRETTSDPTAHAEVLAIRQAAEQLGTWRLDGCTLAVTLEPCPMCAGTLINARVPRLIYGATDPKAGCVGSLYSLCTDPRFNHRLTVVAGLMAEEAATQLKTFFRARRRPRPRKSE